MAEIKLRARKVGQYTSVEVEIDDFKKDWGLFDDKGKKSLIASLKEAIEELEV